MILNDFSNLGFYDSTTTVRDQNTTVSNIRQTQKKTALIPKMQQTNEAIKGNYKIV